MESQTSKGKLLLRVSTGFGAIPVEGAQVFITSFDKESPKSENTFSLRTDSNGLTSEVELLTPAKSLSLVPGSNVLPYSEFVITVKKDGYKTAELIGVPIFDGVTSIQNVSLIPLSEDEILLGGYENDIYYGNGGYENLKSVNNIEGMEEDI